MTSNLTGKVKCQVKGHGHLSCLWRLAIFETILVSVLTYFGTISGTPSFDLKVDLEISNCRSKVLVVEAAQGV